MFIAPYVIAEEDLRLDPLVLTNSALAEGTPPGTDEPIPSPPDEEAIPVDPFGELSIKKTSDTAVLTDDSVGAVIVYSFLVTNTGTAPLDNVFPVDVDFSGTGQLGELTPGPVSLLPGEEQLFTAEYTVTAEDVLAKTLTNSAYATGTIPDSPVDTPTIESPPDEDTVDVEWPKELRLLKTADVSELTHEGQLITYSFEVTNSGREAITDVRPVEVSFSGTGQLSQISPESVDLAPGESQVFTATYRVTSDDLAAGTLENTAIATGNDPEGNPVQSPESQATVTGTAPGSVGGLPATGAAPEELLSFAAGVLLLGAGAFLVLRRRLAP